MAEQVDEDTSVPGPSKETFHYSDLVTTVTTTPQPKPALEDVKFGQAFTDHMFSVGYTRGQGWGAPQIVPFGPISMHPAAQVLHYGSCCFEGMKAYMGDDGRGRLFRPEMNIERLRRSAARLMLADFDPQEFLACLKALLQLDRSWLPSTPGYSVYVRPFMYSTGGSLGIHVPDQCSLGVVLAPVGPYFKTGLRPVSLFLDEEHVRAWPGGVGQYKVGGNYSPTLLPMEKGRAAAGTPQVVYTLLPPGASSPDDAHLSESGAMNFFVLLRRAHSSPAHGRSGEQASGNPAAGSANGGDAGGEVEAVGDGDLELVTPPLDGTILPGVTRDSILRLAKGWGEFRVSERPITIRELKQASREGRLIEMFGCGTACIVQPVESLVRSDGDVLRASGGYHAPSTHQGDGGGKHTISSSCPSDAVGNGATAKTTGPATDKAGGIGGGIGGGGGGLAGRLARELVDIQHGRVEGHPWSVPFE